MCRARWPVGLTDHEQGMGVELAGISHWSSANHTSDWLIRLRLRAAMSDARVGEGYWRGTKALQNAFGSLGGSAVGTTGLKPLGCIQETGAIRAGTICDRTVMVRCVNHLRMNASRNQRRVVPMRTRIEGPHGPSEAGRLLLIMWVARFPD